VVGRYASTHWGLREIVEDAGGPVLRPVAEDPHPNAIGLDQLSPALPSLRVRRPAVRESWLRGGPGTAGDKRGGGPFVEVEWDRALDLVAAELDRVRRIHGNGAIYGGSYGWASAGRFHHAQSQVHRFLNTIGGYVAHRNSYSLGAAHVILPHVVIGMGTLMEAHTDWQTLTEHCELFVTFGGVPEKNAQISAGGVLQHHLPGALARMRAAGAEFVNIGPVADNIPEVAQAEWIPTRPNTDTAFMLALAHVLLEEDLLDRAFLASHCVGFDRFAAYLRGVRDGQPKTPDWAAAITGAGADSIRALARRMAARRTMVNMAWSLQRADHGEQPCWMVVTLAAMLGQIGLPGGGFGIGYGAENVIGGRGRRLPAPTFPQGQNPVGDFIPVARVADMLLNPGASYAYDGEVRTYPDIRLVYWAGGNPFHHHQDLNRLRRAWARPDTIVVNEQYWTATARRADIVFPATTPSEREDIGRSSLDDYLFHMPRLIPAVGEARDDYAIFAGLAGRLGARPAYTEGRDAQDWLHALYAEFRSLAAEQGVEVPDYAGLKARNWMRLPIRAEGPNRSYFAPFRENREAHPPGTPSGRIEIFSDRIDGFGYDDCPGHPVWLPPSGWLGAATHEAPLHLVSPQPGDKLHSQLEAALADVPGARPVALAIHPEDAALRGIASGALVRVFNPRGACRARAAVTADILPGVVALPTGAWLGDAGGNLDPDGNPNVLTRDLGTSRLGQGSSAHTTMVDVAPLEG